MSDCNEEFFYAARAGNIENIKNIISSKKVDVNCKDEVSVSTNIYRHGYTQTVTRSCIPVYS